MPTRPKSPAGIQRTRARNDVRAAERAVAKAETAVAEAESDAVRTVAEERLSAQTSRLAEARVALAETLGATDGQPTESPRHGMPKVPPTTFKRGSRHYGHRALRVNQSDVDPAARANVLSEYERHADAE